MKFIKYTLLNLLSFFCLNLNAQLSPKMYDYSGYVTYRVYAVAKVVPLSEERQLMLAKYFLAMDSTAKDLIKQNSPTAKLSNLYGALKSNRGLQDYLSPEEFATYLMTTPSCSRLVTAIGYRNELKIDKEQIALLIKGYNDTFSLPKHIVSEIRPWEETKLLEILGQQKFAGFMALKERPFLEAQAAANWHYIVKEKLADKIDSNLFKQEVSDFLLKRLVARAYLGERKSQRRLDSIDHALYLSKPFILRKVELLKGRQNDQSIFADLIKNRHITKLTSVQIDSFVNRIYTLDRTQKEFQKVNSGAKYKTVNYENDGLAKILSSGQLDLWLNYKLKNSAKNNSARLWTELVAKKLTVGVDENKTREGLMQYELRRLTTAEKYKIKSSSENAKLKQAALFDKPNLLIKLEESKDLTATNHALKRKMAW